MGELRPSGLGQADLEGMTEPLFTAAGRPVIRLGGSEIPALQRLIERCQDYYELVNGEPAGPDEARKELTDWPPEPAPKALCLGIAGEGGDLIGLIGVLRHHRRPDQWYVGTMLLDPARRGQGFGRAVYEAFEAWIVGEGGNSILLAVVEPNHRAARFWESVGFDAPRCYPERPMGRLRHVLIEYEKDIG